MPVNFTALIRLLTLPGSDAAIAAATFRPWRPVVAGALRTLAKSPLKATRDLDEVADIYEGLAEHEHRTAVRRVTGHVLDWRGQFVTMTDRTYLARLMPVLVVWGRDDMVIPAAHAEAAPRHSSSKVHIFDDSGHFPHKDHPEAFCELIEEFVAEHEPAHYHRGRWRSLLRRGHQLELETVPPEGPSELIGSANAG